MGSSRDKKPHLRAFADRNLGIPAKPCLIGDLKFFAMPDGLGIQVRGGEQVVVLRGQLCESAIPWLLKMLDGSHTIDEIFDQCPGDVQPQQLSRALMVMFNRGLFAGAARTINGADDMDLVKRKQLLFFGRKLGITRANESADQAQNRLASASLILIGNGLFASVAYDILKRSGLCNIRTIDWANDGFFRDCIDQIDQSSGVSEAPFLGSASRSIEKVAELLEDYLPSADLLITATTSGPNRLFAQINKLCIEQNVAWIRGNDDGIHSEIGPYVLPFNSGCFRCMMLRRTSAAEYAIEEELYDLQLTSNGNSYAHEGEFLAGATVAASVLAAEVIRIVSVTTKPSVENSVLRITADGAFFKDQFERVPRCPECYRGEVKTKMEAGQQSHA